MKFTKLTEETFKNIKTKFYLDMQNANVPDESKYHLEGDAWSHSMMVLSVASEDFKSIALCHDLGKPLAKTFVDGKIRYSGHEGLSTILASDYLTEDELYCVNYHGILWQKSPKQIRQMYSTKQGQKVLEAVVKFSEFDKKGNVSFDETNSKKTKSMEEVQEVLKEILEAKYRDVEQTNRPTMYIMVGLPGSGKSTYIENNLKGIKVVSRDNALMEYGKSVGKTGTYSEVWASLTDADQKEVDKKLQKDLSDAKRGSDDFIVDMTNLSWKSRKKQMNGLKNHRVEMIVFTTSLDTVVLRNAQRVGKTIPTKVLTDMAKRFEMPLYGENENIENIKVVK